MTNGLKNLVEKILEQNEETPRFGGLRRNRCRKCGGTIIRSGRGIVREVCSECGKPYKENRLG